MYITELEEGPQDLISCLRNLAFQLVFDGEASQLAHIRRDICVSSGASEDDCSFVWNEALKATRDLRSSRQSIGFEVAASMAHRLVPPHRFH